MQAVTPLNQVNNTKNFYPADGNWEIVRMPFKASVEISDGYAVGVEISGNTTTGNLTLMPATNANGANFVGILQEKISSTDADYATSGKLRNVLVPTTKRAKARFKVGAGTFTAADVNKVVAFHSDSASLAVDTAGAGAIIVGYQDANYGFCNFDVPNTVTA